VAPAAPKTEPPPLRVLGSGSGGIDEMHDLLDDEDASVQWAFLKFELGSGAFRRSKQLFLHINGAQAPAMARGRANQYTPAVQNYLRSPATNGAGSKGFHASLTVQSKEEVTTEQLLSRVMSFLVSDDLGDHSVQWMLKEYEDQIREASKNSGSDGGRAGRNIPGHDSRALFTGGREALQALRDPEGSWNWMLLRPDPQSLPLVSGGVGSIEEMRECLAEHEDEVLAGLLRMSFGDGRLRRTKHVLVLAVGRRAGPVARGRIASARKPLERALAEFVHISCTMEVASSEDLTLEEVIDRVRRAAHIDDEVLEGDSAGRQLISADAFRKALAEERRAAATQSAGRSNRYANLPVKDVLGLLHADSRLNWALFGLLERTSSARHVAASL